MRIRIGSCVAFIVLVAVLCLGGKLVYSVELTTAKIAEMAAPATVVIEAPDVGQGSGVLVDSGGTVLYCYHVIEGARSALVKLNNGGYFPAQGLLGFNPNMDIAVIKIDGKDLPALPVGDSSALKPGERVVAIGSPKGFENTVSEGVVSALRRVGDFPDKLKTWLMQEGRKEDDVLIQFTAPISHGSSGGPLINSSGQLVGLVALGDFDEAHDVYFAIPVNAAKQYFDTKTVIKFAEIDFTALGGIRRRVGSGPADLGLGKPADNKTEFVIPKGKEPTYKSMPGVLIDTNTLAVLDSKTGKLMKCCETTPDKESYRRLADGSVLFSTQDSGRQIVLTYKARQKRAAIMPIVSTSNLDYMRNVVQEGITEALSGFSFEILPDAEVNAVVRELQINVDGLLYGIPDAVSPENITKLADKLNACYLVLAGVGSSGNIGYWGSSAGCDVTVVMFEGKTGKTVLTKRKSANKDTTFSLSGQRATRQRMAKGLVRKMLNEYFGLKD
ncbi:MAG: trypsin-like peptidase domain-containing protein [Armatimonadota bacterium]|nr:trypsin-like peptidase domain-containing protein [Armatimonadota bacterium]